MAGDHVVQEGASKVLAVFLFFFTQLGYMGVYENILSHILRIFHFSEYTLYFNKLSF